MCSSIGSAAGSTAARRLGWRRHGPPVRLASLAYLPSSASMGSVASASLSTMTSSTRWTIGARSDVRQ